jgi:hypothetical protein
MNSPFRVVYRESSVRSNKSQVTDEKELKKLLDAGVETEAKGTGPLGDDEGATVINYGKVKDLRDELTGVKFVAKEEGYDDIEDWLADNEETTIIVLDRLIGQSGVNWYDLNSYNVSELDLWVSTVQMDRVLHNKEVVVCPICGNKVFGHTVFHSDTGVEPMAGLEYKYCVKCGAMYPCDAWKEGESRY